MFMGKRGQSTLEYAVIIAVVVAGLIAMQAYVKRGLQGKLKQASDDIGEQYSPGRTTGGSTVTSTVTSTETVSLDGAGLQGKPLTDTTSDQTQSRTKTEEVQGEKGEYWGD